MKISLNRLNKAVHFEARNSEGNTVQLDGSPAIGGQGLGVRPMEVVLMGLAGCTGIDVVSMLEKMRQPLEDISIEVEAKRREEIPQIFTEIHVTYTVSGPMDREKVERAVNLSAEKYCSVSKMLEQSAVITHSIVYK